MSNEDNSLESGSDVETERRDYPGTFHSYHHTLSLTKHSKMVPLNILQYDYSWALQLQRTRNLGCDEQSRSRWCSVTTSSERWQRAHILLNGCQLLLRQCDCTLHWDQRRIDLWHVSMSPPSFDLPLRTL
jgi:hypothetical protein